MESDDARFMNLALEEAQAGADSGDKFVGAVIVRDGKVIGRGHNTVASDRNPVLHAEIAAIENACAALGTAQLEGATLYATMEPCPMCLWAIHVAGIGRLVLGGRHASMGRPDLGRYSVERLMEMTEQRIELVTGVRTEECERRRRAWQAAQGEGSGAGR